jgi:hypothetical protein
MTTKCFHCGCGHESKECPTYGGVAPRVGDVWRWQHDPRVAYLVEKIGDDTVDGRFVEDPTARYQGPQSIKARYFRDVYTFDAEATAKAKAAANCQAAVDVVLAGTTLAGPPRAELPEYPIGTALTDSVPGPDRPGHHFATVRINFNAPVLGADDADRLAAAAKRVSEMRLGPWTFDMDDGLGPLTNEERKQIAARAASAPRCPRCAGPAYVGLMTVVCERVGGCRTAADSVAEEEARVGPCVIARVGQRGTFAGEPYWQALVDGVSSYHPTREGAVLAWRAAAIAAERGR